MDKYDADFAARIRTCLNETAPFGPLDAGKILDPEVAALLFDRQIDAVRSVLGKNFVVGRRGSGKSAALKAQTRKDAREHSSLMTQAPARPAYDYIISLYAWREFPQIQKALADFERASPVPLPVEWMAEKWEAVFWFYAAREIQLTTDGLARSSKSFVALDNLLGNGGQTESLLKDLKSIIIEGPSSELVAHARGAASTPHWERVRDATTQFLTANSRKVVLALDSMEQYPIRQPTFQATLNGLMRAVVQINSNLRNMRLIFCLPSEIYAHFFAQSSNPLKDFDSVEFLHWSARGLLQVAAFRYRLFLELHDEATAREVAKHDIHDRRGLAAFWQYFLPSKVTNRLGWDESPLAYLLRHTQLLPRQLLKILNEIAVSSHRRTGGWRLFPEEIIRESVRDAEEIIAREVFSAFHAVYPDALNVCRATMSRVPTEVKYGELQKQWRSHAQPAMAQMGFLEFREFVEMLSEIGVIGRVSARRPETDRYVYADFEYREKDRLILDDTQRICIHPVFYALFQIKTVQGQKTVYPIGTDVDDED